MAVQEQDSRQLPHSVYVSAGVIQGMGVEPLLRKRVRAQIKMRQCLSCDEMFLSRGPHNRICADCKVGTSYSEEEDPNQERLRINVRGGEGTIRYLRRKR